MIDRRPVIGDLADDLLDVLAPFDNEHTPTLFEEEPERRESALLGPNGEPIVYVEERQKIGFDLRPVKKS
jgi:hypothetical protein